MPSGFPGSIDNFTDPLSNSPLNSPSHSGLHADVNDAVEKIETYMGLVKVIPTAATNGTIGADGSVTVGNAVSSVSITCFSALYDNYRIIYMGGTASGSNNFAFTLGASATGYSEALIYNTYTSSTVLGANRTGQANWQWCGSQQPSPAGNTLSVDIYRPNVAAYTFYKNATWGLNASNGHSSGVHEVATAYTSFTIAPTAGTITGGTIRIYGYRN